jgi:hypothetical protein
VLQVLTKATTDRARAERLLAQQTRAINRAFLAYVQSASRAPIAEFLARGNVEAVLTLLDRHIENFAASMGGIFVDAAAAEMAVLSRKLTMKAATVQLAFDPGNEEAARLMQRNRLNLLTNLTNSQRGSVRTALVAGLRAGDSPQKIGRRFRYAIGLNTEQQRQLAVFEQAQHRLKSEDLDVPEAARPPIFSDRQIETVVARRAEAEIAARAERIARTEAVRIVGQAQDQALRQSLQATGQSVMLTGKEWNSHQDARTREAHSSADGQRRRLDDDFDIGGERIAKPGDGSAHNAIGCRCVLTFEFFDSEAEMKVWLEGGN